MAPAPQSKCLPAASIWDPGPAFRQQLGVLGAAAQEQLETCLTFPFVVVQARQPQELLLFTESQPQRASVCQFSYSFLVWCKADRFACGCLELLLRAHFGAAYEYEQWPVIDHGRQYFGPQRGWLHTGLLQFGQCCGEGFQQQLARLDVVELGVVRRFEVLEGSLISSLFGRAHR